MSVFFVERTPVVHGWLEQRRELGLDGKDEVWGGVYHVTPHEHGRNGRTASRLEHLLYASAAAVGLESGRSFNLGTASDYRVPDLGYHRTEIDTLFYPTAAMVVEVLSPNDETFAKFGFYAAHGVEELWVVDPLERSVRIWQLGAETDGGYAETGRSDLLDLTGAWVEQQLDWPKG